MPLTMLPTGLASPDYQDRQDWTIHPDGSGRVPIFGLAKADWLCSWMACSKQRERSEPHTDFGHSRMYYLSVGRRCRSKTPP